MNREDALSRTSIIVIAISIVLIIAAAAVMIFFSSGPAKVPHMNATIEASGNIVYLYHDGGDPFPKDRILVRVNGEDIPESGLSLLHSQDWPWTAGKTIKVVYGGSTSPEYVDVIYKDGQKQTVVISQQLQGAPAPVVTATPVPTTTGVPGSVTPIVTPESPGPGVPVTTPEIPVIMPLTMVIPEVTPTPPRADFSARPTSGQLPLVVQFTDLSTGIPSKWSWNFGDGSVSTERSPVHQYTTQGSYTVSLVVENKYGSDKKTIPGYISAGIAPVANFGGSPRTGEAPLEVHFTDLSTGQPAAWLWNFGDGSESTLQNPTHIYSNGGSYTVSLTVANTFGADTRIQSTYIQATAPLRHDVYLYGSSQGYLVPDGYISFSVPGSDSWIKIAGKIYRFAPDDAVQLIIQDPSSGTIDITSSAITDFSFNKVSMYVNGNLAAEGIVSAVNINGYQNYRSSTTLIVPAGDSGAVFFADGSRVLIGPGQQLVIRNLKPDSTGRMAFSKNLGNLYYKGGAESWQIV